MRAIGFIGIAIAIFVAVVVVPFIVTALDAATSALR